MKLRAKQISLSIVLFLIIAVTAGTAFSQDKKTIVGEVTEFYQIVTKDEVAYDIGDNEMGDKMIEEAVGKKVKATGVVTYDEETESNTITVEKYTVVEEEE